METGLLGEVRALARCGLYRDALLRLRQGSSRAYIPNPLLRVAEAELLQRTGDLRQANEIARKILREKPADRGMRARCHIVLGDCARLTGSAVQASPDYQRAARYASDANDLEQSCWAQLRLMMTISEQFASESTVSFIKKLRRNVARLGDPHVTAALHLFVGQLETQRGLLDTGSRHLHICQSILQQEPNAWLDGTAAIDAMCLAYLRSEIPRALTLADQALKIAETSGFVANRISALTNLGHLYIRLGNFERAHTFLDEALEGCTKGGRSEVAILDGLARLCVVQGHAHEAHELLRKVDELSNGFKDEPYEVRWGRLTRLRLLIQEGRLEEAHLLLERSQEAAAQAGDKQLELVLKISRAELALLGGRLTDATETLVTTFGQLEGASVDTWAEVDRLAALLFFHTGRSDLSKEFLKRSLESAKAVPNYPKEIEILSTYRLCFGSFGVEESVAESARWKGDEQPFGTPSDEVRTIETVLRILAVFNHVRHCELVGRHVLALLQETKCFSEAELRLHRTNRVDVLLTASCSSVGSTSVEDAVLLQLGDSEQGKYELFVVPRSDLYSRMLLLTLAKILNFAVELDRARTERRERAALWPQNELPDSIEGVVASETLVGMLKTAEKVATSNITTLITGATGTGKEVLARAIHQGSSRAGKPFVPFNCTAVPREMIDSQLFGYRRGAFTGAHEHFPGVIRAAAGGTLFLDEIGELGLDIQPKFLRFLESSEVHPLGEAQPLKVDVRVIAATNLQLEQLITDGRFREDLYYRLDVIRFDLPPLRERREEIPVLIQHFLKRYSDEFKREQLEIAEETMEYLLLYSWPGNVRQLANELRRIVALAENGAVIMPEHLSSYIVASRRTVPASDRALASTEIVVRLDQPLSAAVRHVERSMLTYALMRTGGRVEPAAQMLGLSRKGLYLKRQRLGLQSLEAHG
jgi:DNA-binding NtrC family response regulator/tetratricopeptide (TPR) repeat protein